MKITGYRKTKGSRALVGALLLCAVSAQSMESVQSLVVILGDGTLMSFSSLLVLTGRPTETRFNPDLFCGFPQSRV